MRPPTFVLSFAVACLAVTAVAQSAPCFATNDLNNNSTNVIYSLSSVGPSTWGWQITPPAPVAVQAMRVYTGNNYTSQVGTHMSLALWSDAGGVPGTPLGSGTWQIQPAKSWQGANLDAVVLLQTNTPYWVMFTEPGWSTPPHDPAGTTFPGGRLLNGAWTVGGATGLKCRLFCAELDAPGAVPFGNLCTTSTGALGTLFTNQAASVGNVDFRLEGTGFPGGALALLVAGFVPGYPSVPIPGTPGCWQSTDPQITFTGFTGTGNVRAATTLGHVAFPFPLPNDPGFVGLYFAAQVAVMDAAAVAPIPFVTSNALQLTLF